nr:hypothetical protein [Tanacetum cinerariifolium]
MSRDVITIGSTMRIPLLYRGKYSQWRERFMNYLEEQTDGEAMISSIQNGDEPLPTAEEKKTRKIDRLARSLLIQGLLNDNYSFNDSNETTKDLWDALKRQMHSSEYGEQDRKAAILYEYDTFKGDVNDALVYKKKVVVVTLDPLALVAEKTKAFNQRKFYFKPTNNNLRTSSTSQSANKKQEFVKSDDKKVEKKDDEKKRDMNKVKCYNCKKERHFAKDCKKAKEINANMVFMAQIEKVVLDSDESSSSAEETIAEEQNNEFNEQIKVLNEKNADLLAQMEVLQDQLKVKHVVIDTHTECQAQYAKLEEERYEYMIRYSALCDNDKQHRKKIDEQDILFDKISQLEGCVSNKDVEIEKCLERLNECENKLHKIIETNQTIHMIMPFKDTLYNGRKGIGFENAIYFEKAKDLRPSLYDENVIGLGYTLMFLIYSDEALEIKKLKEQERIKSSLHTIMGI